MRVAIIGGGITGLSAAYDLSRQGVSVELFEKENKLGGLASGFRMPGWEWPLEGAYHHIFANDADIIGLSRELGIGSDIMFSRPVTATIWNGKTYQLDSPKSLLTFPGIPPGDRVRTGMMIAFLKLNPFWRPFERFTARDVYIALGGRRAWQVIWEPLMTGKFDSFAGEISAAWLWARIKKRTASLGYFRGGFARFTETLGAAAGKSGARIRTGVTVSEISAGKRISVTVDGEKRGFDAVLVTVPSPVFVKIAPSLPSQYINRLLSVPHLHAHILIVETTRPVLEHIYWLNITDRTFPFLAAVAHTNYVDPQHYGGRHILYLGNYLSQGHPLFGKDAGEVLSLYEPFLKKLNPAFKASWITGSRLFIGPYAQPVHTRNYSRKAPPFETPISNVYLANMDSIVPWDRGTNYAVRLGRTAAQALIAA